MEAPRVHIAPSFIANTQARTTWVIAFFLFDG